MKSLQTMRKFCLKHNLEVQACRVFIDAGLVPAHSYVSKRKTYVIVDSDAFPLLEGTHYVECPACNKKMISVSATHIKSCTGMLYSTFTDYYKGATLLSEFATTRKKKTEAQKIAQSVKLTERFNTPAGVETKKKISEASIRYNSSESVRKAKSKIMVERLNAPGAKQKHSSTSKAMWADPSFLAKIKKYHDDNKELIALKATKARSYLNKTSKLHLNFKASLPEAIKNLFETEYPLGPYSLDEGCPAKKLSIEIDGCYWHGCATCGFPGVGYIQLIEKRKKTYLTNRGWSTLHVKECDIKKNIESCIQEVIVFVEGAT